ncbi:MAG: MOSC domain-containing protein [bacterium]
MGRIRSINLSEKKGTPKTPVEEAVLVENLGLEGDAHAEPGIRQVSLLSAESIERARTHLEERARRASVSLVPGVFAENLTTEGIDLSPLEIGSLLQVGSGVVLRVSKIGKECHHGCVIFRQVGDCIMPRQGIFCEVLKGGRVRKGDTIERVSG